MLPLDTLARNRAAHAFRQFHAAYCDDARSARTETLAAELAAVVAQDSCAVCIGLYAPKELRKVYSMAWTLQGYGVTLRTKARPDGSIFLYCGIERRDVTAFVGTVREVQRMRAAA